MAIYAMCGQKLREGVVFRSRVGDFGLCMMGNDVRVDLKKKWLQDPQTWFDVNRYFLSSDWFLSPGMSDLISMDQWYFCELWLKPCEHTLFPQMESYGAVIASAAM